MGSSLWWPLYLALLAKSSDVIKTFILDLNFKTKTKPSVQDQDQDFASQDQDVYQRPTEKHFSFSAVKRKWWRKWNSIYGRKRNEKLKMDIPFRPKNENESHLIILVFFSFSYIQSPSQPYNALPIPRPVSPFLQVVLLDGITFSSCTVVHLID